jgi:hypothetical protein
VRLSRFLTSILLASACATVQAPLATYSEPEPVESDLDVVTVWDAAVDAATQYHLPILTLARESGYMATDRVLLPEPAGGAWWDCGLAPDSERAPQWYNPFDSLPVSEGGRAIAPSLVSGIVAVAIVPRHGVGGMASRVRVTVSALQFEGSSNAFVVLCTSRGTFEAGFAATIVQRARELKAPG